VPGHRHPPLPVAYPAPHSFRPALLLLSNFPALRRL